MKFLEKNISSCVRTHEEMYFKNTCRDPRNLMHALLQLLLSSFPKITVILHSLFCYMILNFINENYAASLSDLASFVQHYICNNTSMLYVVVFGPFSFLLSILLCELHNLSILTAYGKGQFSFQSKEKQYQRMFNYRTVALISHTSKVMLRIRQARLQRYVN